MTRLVTIDHPLDGAVEGGLLGGGRVRHRRSMPTAAAEAESDCSRINTMT
jgi:hypothetical protein